MLGCVGGMRCASSLLDLWFRALPESPPVSGRRENGSEPGAQRGRAGPSRRRSDRRARWCRSCRRACAEQCRLAVSTRRSAAHRRVADIVRPKAGGSRAAAGTGDHPSRKVIGILAYFEGAVKGARVRSVIRRIALRRAPPRCRCQRGQFSRMNFKRLKKNAFGMPHATSCQLGFVRGTPGSIVGFSGSIVDSPGSLVDSSGSFAGFRAEMSRYMTITNAYGAYSGEDYDK